VLVVWLTGKGFEHVDVVVRRRAGLLLDGCLFAGI